MAPVTLVVCVGGFLALLVAWLAGGAAVDVAWAPALDLRLHARVDGLGALYGLLATGIGAVVATYAIAYLPRHLAHQNRPSRDGIRFWWAFALFAAAMVGLACAQDLVLLFVCWDLTAVASWALIGFDRHERASRAGALMALMVTGATAVLLLVAALLLYREYGTFQLPELFEALRPTGATTVAGFLVAVAALAKSAQVPLHFWLPRAMAAPTPVSAYLHSAAMVAAGVFLLSRMHRLLAAGEGVLDLLLVTGLASIAVGGVLALTRDAFKQLLACSTISQYGYVTFLLSLGSAKGALAACLYVLAHAPAKCALFLTAGAVTEATGGRTALSQVGGLARAMPVLAVASGVAAAGLAALPLTIGFFKDELLFGAAAEAGAWQAACAVGAATLTLVYMARFWSGIFLGPRQAEAHAMPRLLVAPVVGLAAVVLAAGLVPAPFGRLAEDAAAATTGRPVDVGLAYHLDLRTENVLALVAYAIAVLLLLTARAWAPAARAVAAAGDRAGPERAYRGVVMGLNRLSDAIHDLEVRDLRGRVAAVLVPAAALVGATLLATPSRNAYQVGGFAAEDLALVLALAATALAAVTAMFPRRHLVLVLAVSAAGFSLAVVYALLGGADVALVAVLVEVLLTLLLLAVIALVPEGVLRREAELTSSRGRRVRDGVLAVAGGLVAFFVVWGGLSRPTPEVGVAAGHLERTESAHAHDTVTAILADFRGLDTLVEITVVFAAALAVRALLRRTVTA
jgi:multicomponent Na+:H+ antiporter subunit A